jgi:hypothetical protein
MTHARERLGLAMLLAFVAAAATRGTAARGEEVRLPVTRDPSTLSAREVTR